jgi:hypothetical protein
MTRTIFIAAALALAVTLPAAPANAQTAIRTYVSITGNDTNPCSLTAPCRHFQAAANATAAGGEIDALDPGGYGSFTISQAISIEGEGWSYLAPPPGGAAITVNANSGDVNIRGVSLDGVGISDATGILFNSGTTLNVQNSVIRNFSNSGISFAPTSSSPSQFFMSNSLVSDNGGQGVAIATSTSGGTVAAALSEVTISNNHTGVSTSASAAPLELLISYSHIDNNASVGINAQGQSSSATSNVILQTVTLNQTPTAIDLPNFASAWLSHVTQTSISGIASTVAVNHNPGSSAAYSDGTNFLMGSFSGGGLGSFALQ